MRTARKRRVIIQSVMLCEIQEREPVPEKQRFYPKARDSGLEFAVKQFDESFGVGSFAGSADGDVPDADDRDVELPTLEHTPVEQPVTDVDHAPVNPCQWGGQYFTQ